MNQQHQPVMSPVPPAVPYGNGRPGQNLPYQQPYPSYYHYPPPYPYQPQYHHMHRPPPHWQPYPMQMPINRQQHPFPPHMNPYPPQQYQPMRPVPHHHPSSASIHSTHGMISPSPSQQQQFAPPSASPPIQSPQIPHLTPPPPKAPSPVQTPTPTRAHFDPPLPWQTFLGEFPPQKIRRRRKPRNQTLDVPVQLPPRPETSSEEEMDTPSTQTEVPELDVEVKPAAVETPATSNPPSEIMSTQPTTPTSSVPPQQSNNKPSNPSHATVPSISIRPAIPNIPLPSRNAKQTKTESVASESTKPATSVAENTTGGKEQASSTVRTDKDTLPGPPAVKAPPKSWADLVRSKAPPKAAVVSGQETSADASATSNGVFISKATSLADVLASFKVKGDSELKTAFIEPRGLVNTGNMCYMNSVLQILLFCVPFYAFLEKVGKQATHSFNSDTPMMDAMIMFMREFKIIDAATSVDQLRMRLKDNELEQYGEAFIPEFVYNVIRRLPRFSSMRRGHQQDAEEFLGFLLEELHDECARTLKVAHGKPVSGASSPNESAKSPTSEFSSSQKTEEGGWLEVGPKQRPSTTRSSGIAAESPITKIFGGNLRSELRVPGMKNSVTLEPYQPLQLDIGSPNVHNIVDALKGLTKPETLHGEFNSPRGPGSTATKQVTIETLPEVLILHLKRFQYDNAGGTQKIWKKVGYPLDLEIPKEVFPQHKRGGLLAHGGLPQYRLIGVVYHHGKNASTGHYTVDVRRQEGIEWIRLDDTVIRRVRSEDVAAGGSEEDPKVLAMALEQHKKDQAVGNKTTANFYDGFAGGDDDNVEGEKPKVEKAWSQVAEGGNNQMKKKTQQQQLTNGNVTPRVGAAVTDSGRMTPVARTASALKEGRVAYILFYQKIGA